MGDVETLNYDDLSAVAKLSSEARYKKIMSDVRSAMEASTSGGQEAEPFRGPLEDDPTYK